MYRCIPLSECVKIHQFRLKIGAQGGKNTGKRHFFSVFFKKYSKMFGRFRKYVYICTKNVNPYRINDAQMWPVKASNGLEI